MITRRAPTFYTAEQWTSLIEDCRSSGISKKAWCAEKGITPSTMYRWEHRLAEADPGHTDHRAHFVEVDIQQMVQSKSEKGFCPLDGQSSRPEFTIEYGSCRIHMNAGFTEEDLRKAMRVIRDAE